MRPGNGNLVVSIVCYAPMESLHEKWLYIRENPVRAGLVKDWKDGHTDLSLTSKKRPASEALALQRAIHTWREKKLTGRTGAC